MNRAVATNAFQKAFKAAQCKYMGTVRGDKQAYVTDDELQPLEVLDEVFEQIDFKLSGENFMIADARGEYFRFGERPLVKLSNTGNPERGSFVVSFNEDYFVEILYGTLGDDVEGGSCFFVLFD